MSLPRVLLVADPPAGPRIADRLHEYVDVEHVRAQGYTGVPAGTEWVLVMNAGGKTARIAADAKHVGASVVSIPPGWSAMQEILTRHGFWKGVLGSVQKAAVVNAALTHRPLERLADTVARRTGAAPPLPSVADALLVEGQVTQIGKALTAQPPSQPEPAPPPVPEPQPAAPVAEDEKVHMRGEVTARDAARGRETIAARQQHRTAAKRALLRLVFDKNPDATVREAQSALRTMSTDGRGMEHALVAEIRNEVRAAHGLAPIIGRGNHQPHHWPAPPAKEEAAMATANTPKTPPPTAAKPEAPPPLRGPGLPPDVEAAARLLREALEASRALASFTLTFTAGERTRVRWAAMVENDTEV